MAKAWFEIGGYSQWVDLEDSAYWSCTCLWGSSWRGSTNKPCKHIREIIGNMELTERQKEMLKEMVDWHCERCKFRFPSNKLEVHRIIRGEKGGKYIPSNIKILCDECHKFMHGNEFQNIRSRK